MTRRKTRLSIALIAIYLFLMAPLAAAPPAGGPLLWRVEGAHPSYFFGTLHSADPRVSAIAPAALAALASSRSFHPEVDLSPEIAGQMAARLFNPAAPDLETRLPPALWRRVRTAGARIGLPEPLLRHLSPGLAGLLFAVPPDTTDLDATMDGQLSARARALGLTIAALETLDEQLDLFDRLAPAPAQAFLAEALDDSDAGYAQLARLIDAYASGDEARIAAVVQEEFARPAVRALADPLLHHRNEIMAARAEPWLRKGGAFVAVGAAHLVGRRSVIERLRARGFKITRVR